MYGTFDQIFHFDLGKDKKKILKRFTTIGVRRQKEPILDYMPRRTTQKRIRVVMG